MKTLYFNGNIYTGSGFTHSLLEENGVILAMGDAAAMRAEGAKAFDLEGKTVVPGFNDSHLHLMGLGKHLLSVNLLGCKSIDEVKKRTADFIKNNNVEKGAFVTGRGWNQDYFEGEKRLLTRDDLDEVSKDHPIILRRACGHMLTCNSLALEKAGIDENTPAVSGGEIRRDEKGRLSGIFTERAMGLVEGAVPRPDAETVAKYLKKGMEYAASYGLTSLQPNDINDMDYPLIDEAYHLLEQRGEMKTRINVQCCFNTVEGYEKFLNDGYYMGKGNSLYKIGPLKLFVDGSLGARTALMRKPYKDDPNAEGILCTDEKTLDEFYKLAESHKMQVVTHAIGDRAVEMVLGAIERNAEKGNPLRHGVVHAQITDKALLERFKELNAFALVQPIFLHYDMHIVEQRVGKELAETSYNFKTLDDMGVCVSFGTDSPVEDVSTFDNLHCAVNRQDLKGFPEGGYVPSERFSVENAVKCYTHAGALTSFEEYEKGLLEPGMMADFAVLDRNIFEIDKSEIIKTKVLMTVMGGNITYKR